MSNERIIIKIVGALCFGASISFLFFDAQKSIACILIALYCALNDINCTIK